MPFSFLSPSYVFSLKYFHERHFLWLIHLFTYFFIYLNSRVNKIRTRKIWGVLKLKYQGYMGNNSLSIFYTKLSQHSQKITSDLNISLVFCYLWNWEGDLKIQWHDWKIISQFHSWLKTVMTPLKTFLTETFDNYWFKQNIWLLKLALAPQLFPLNLKQLLCKTETVCASITKFQNILDNSWLHETNTLKLKKTIIQRAESFRGKISCICMLIIKNFFFFFLFPFYPNIFIESCKGSWSFGIHFKIGYKNWN